MAKKKAGKPALSPENTGYVEDANGAPQSDTRAAAEGKADTEGPSAKFWLAELRASDKREEKWRKRGNKVVERYRDEREKSSNSDRRTNILWSNTELLRAVLFQKVGSADVRRRYPKKGKDEKAARQAALSLERSLNYCADAYDSESQVDSAIEDMLLPGRGQCWVVYDAEMEYGSTEGAPDADASDGPENEIASASDASPRTSDGYAQDGEEQEPSGIANQEVRFEHVYWEDYRTSAGRKEADIWWKARRHQYTRDELNKYFPDYAKVIPMDAEVATGENNSKNNKDDDTFKRANVWEVWDKTKKQRVYIAEGFSTILRQDDDPYKLKGFFPCPSALYGVKTTSSLVPIPEYTLYQDQAEELDDIGARLAKMIDAMKRRGVYDAGLNGADKQLGQLADAGDNEFLPFKGFSGLMEKGGLKGAFQTEDLSPIVQVVQELTAREAALVQKIYEITGIADVMRGASNPNETLGAQQIKANFGSLRIKKRTGRVETFVRDLYRIKAELIAEHFTREKIVEMTGIDMPLQAEVMQAQQALQQLQAMQQQMAQQQAQAQQQPPQGGSQGGTPQQGGPSNVVPFPQGQQGALTQPPFPQAPMGPAQPPPMPSPDQVAQWQETAKAVPWEDISAILRSDERRGYKVDIETVDTARADEQEEKQSRIEFVQAMEQFMATSIPAAIQLPPFIPLVKEMAQFMVKGFKAGRPLEEAFEDAFQKLADNPPPPPGAAPDPVAAAQADKIKQETQQGAQKHESDMANAQSERQLKALDVQLRQADLQGKQQDMAANAQQMDMDFLHGHLDAGTTIAEHHRDEQAHHADMAQANIGLHGAVADQHRQQASHAVSIEGAQADQQHKALLARSKAASAQSKPDGGANGSAQPPSAASVPAVGQAPVSGLQQALMQMAQAITQMAETNAQVLKAVSAPRTVKIVRDAAGRAAGAVQQVMNLDQPALGSA